MFFLLSRCRAPATFLALIILAGTVVTPAGVPAMAAASVCEIVDWGHRYVVYEKADHLIQYRIRNRDDVNWVLDRRTMHTPHMMRCRTCSPDAAIGAFVWFKRSRTPRAGEPRDDIKEYTQWLSRFLWHREFQTNVEQLGGLQPVQLEKMRGTQTHLRLRWPESGERASVLRIDVNDGCAALEMAVMMPGELDDEKRVLARQLMAALEIRKSEVTYLRNRKRADPDNEPDRGIVRKPWLREREFPW